MIGFTFVQSDLWDGYYNISTRRLQGLYLKRMCSKHVGGKPEKTTQKSDSRHSVVTKGHTANWFSASANTSPAISVPVADDIEVDATCQWITVKPDYVY